MFKRRPFWLLCAVTAACVCCVNAANLTDTNKWYPTNRPPLKKTQFVMLPVGTVKPLGWLLQQCQLMAHGLTGHLYQMNPPSSQDDIATYIMNSKWRNDANSGDRWEAGPYYVNGMIPLAYILNNQALITEATTNWVATMLKHKADWFANVTGDDIWASSEAWQALRSWFEATGEKDTADFYPLCRNYFNLLSSANWGTSWAWARADENFLALAWYYRRTRDGSVINIAQNIKNNTCNWTPIYETMMSGANDLRNAQGWYMQSHVVNHGMAIKFGAAYWPFLTAVKADSQAAFDAPYKMTKYHGQAPGNFSGDESIAGLKAWHGTETCAIVEQMYSYENMLEMFGAIDWADKLEYLAYNHFPGKMTPDGWNRQYHSQVNQVSCTNAARDWMSGSNMCNLYANFNTTFRCCTVNLNQGWPKFVVNSWMATQDNGLAAMVYAPTTVTAKVGSLAAPDTVTINETTQYPFRDTVTFTITTNTPVAFPLVVRVPQWGQGMTISAPATAVITAPSGGSATSGLNASQWINIANTWKNGDVVTVILPFKLRAQYQYQSGTYSGTTETFSNPGMVICRGPLFFASRIATTWTKLLQYTNCMGAAQWQLLPSSGSGGYWNYALCVDTNNVAGSFKVVDQGVNPVYPWGAKGDMLYDSTSNTEGVAFAGDAPIVLKGLGKRVASWGITDNSASDPPASPLTTLGSVSKDSIQLIPYGCSRLRITVFPWEQDAAAGINPEAARQTAMTNTFFEQQALPGGVALMVNRSGTSYKIDIIGASGRTVRSFSGNKAARYILSRSTFSPGIYVVEGRAGSMRQTSRIVIN